MGLRGLATASDPCCSHHVAASVPARQRGPVPPLAKAVHRASNSTQVHNAHRFHQQHRLCSTNRRSRTAPPMAQPSTSQGASALRMVDGYEDDNVLNSTDLAVQAASPLPPHGAHAPSMDEPGFISDDSSSSSSSSNSGEAQVHELRAQLEELRSLVTTQQEVIRSQQVVVEELKRRTVEPPPQPPPEPPKPAPLDWSSMPASPFEAQRVGFIDRRHLGMFDARYHSTNTGATPKDFRVLPDKIILVRHAESEGNVDNAAYTYIPDPQVPLTARGHQQARQTGQKIKQVIDTMGKPNAKLFFYTSPYKRSLQTYEGISSAFTSDQIRGVQEEVQLREQDFGNFQDAEGKQREKADRLRFGRFFYRFPNGESGADVYDRITIFEDHMIRDINAGRFGRDTSLVLVSHGLALRVFLMRWFHWTVDQFLNVYNPPNCEPLVLERVTTDEENRPQGQYSWVHTKALYRLASDSMHVLKGCSEDMCVTSHESKSRISKTRQLG